MKKIRLRYLAGFPGILFFLGAVLCLSGCGEPPNPLNEVIGSLSGLPAFSIILDDMKDSGNIFADYHHKYRIVTPEKAIVTDWREVPEKIYRQYFPFLGMTIYVKKDGQGATKVGPPGYEYVGDRRYGNWQTNSSGQSFWIFYGQYRLMSDLLGRGPIYRSHYNNYASRRGPYFGPKKQYGTNGSYTKLRKPNFYSRGTSLVNSAKGSFSTRVNQRIGRTKSGVRGRSGGVGK